MVKTLTTPVADELEIQALQILFEAQQPTDILHWAIEKYGAKLGIVTSFQASGMAILDMAVKINPAIRVMTLDTGRLPEESYGFMEEVQQYYGINIEVIYPATGDVQKLVSRHGVNLFYKDFDLRLQCCHTRKVLPLQKALGGLNAWITGLRRDQWASRSNINKIEIDAKHDGIVKLNPLADWTEADVEDYSKRHNVPRHPLYSLGYKSIGCAPCTRPIAPGENPRAGRWWWEKNAPKECGIHCGIERRGF